MVIINKLLMRTPRTPRTCYMCQYLLKWPKYSLLTMQCSIIQNTIQQSNFFKCISFHYISDNFSKEIAIFYVIYIPNIDQRYNPNFSRHMLLLNHCYIVDILLLYCFIVLILMLFCCYTVILLLYSLPPDDSRRREGGHSRNKSVHTVRSLIRTILINIIIIINLIHTISLVIITNFFYISYSIIFFCKSLCDNEIDYMSLHCTACFCLLLRGINGSDRS